MIILCITTELEDEVPSCLGIEIRTVANLSWAIEIEIDITCMEAEQNLYRADRALLRCKLCLRL